MSTLHDFRTTIVTSPGGQWHMAYHLNLDKLHSSRQFLLVGPWRKAHKIFKRSNCEGLLLDGALLLIIFHAKVRSRPSIQRSLEIFSHLVLEVQGFLAFHSNKLLTVQASRILEFQQDSRVLSNPDWRVQAALEEYIIKTLESNHHDQPRSDHDPPSKSHLGANYG